MFTTESTPYPPPHYPQVPSPLTVGANDFVGSSLWHFCLGGENLGLGLGTPWDGGCHLGMPVWVLFFRASFVCFWAVSDGDGGADLG